MFRDAFSFFACGKVNSLAVDGGCRQIHLPHAIFSHVQSLHRSHSTDDMCAWLKLSSLSWVSKIGQSFPASCFHSTLNTSTSSLSPTSPVLPSSSSPNPDLLSTYSLVNPLRRQDFFHPECVDDTFVQICCTKEVLEGGLQRLHRRFGLIVERDRRRKSHNTTIRQCSGVSKGSHVDMDSKTQAT